MYAYLEDTKLGGVADTSEDRTRISNDLDKLEKTVWNKLDEIQLE